MVSQIPPVLCPKCKKGVLGIDKKFGGRPDLVEVQAHHFHTQEICVFKMSYQDYKVLANRLSSDIGGRK